uniref:Oxysterol-binding protein n=1 Tax=Schistocephalus solidus TaxID=70667 RepID=A0A0X3NRK0_SCHSO
MSVLPSPSKNSALLGDISSTEYKREAASDLAVGQKSDNVEFGGGKTRSEYQPSSAANSPSSNNRRLRPRLAPGIPKSTSAEHEDLSSTLRPHSYIYTRSQMQPRLQESSSTSHLTVSSSSTDARSPHGRKGTLTSAGSMPSLRVLPNQGGSSASRKVPEPLEGYILKGRKWPLKGYHKRFFRISTGCLAYAKTPSALSKGRYSARIDLANTFVTAEKAKLNIEIDASIVVYHLKFESQADFQHWLQAITEHRQFDQHQNAISAVKQGEARHPPPIEPIEKRTASPVGLSSYQLLNGQMEKAQAPLQSSASEQVSPVGKRVPVQLAPQSAMSSPQLREQMAQDNAMTSLLRAFHFLKKDYDHFCEVQDSLSKITTGRDVTGPSPTRTEFFSPMSTLNSPVPFVPEQSPDLLGHMRKASSLSSFHSAQTIVRKTSTGDSDLCGRLQTVLSDTNAAASALSESAKSFLEKAKSVMERLSQLPPDVNSHPNTVFRRSKPPIDRISLQENDVQTKETNSVFTNICGGLAERVDSETETESDTEKTEGDSLAETSSLVDALFELPPTTEPFKAPGGEVNQRRTQLPAPQPDISRFSLLSLLRSNIGRDLTRVRLPVILNEPLSALQVLCEEMEYSELLDIACTKTEPAERMIYIATFAVSGYARTAQRAATKPFNPLLGETFECLRPEKDWRFMAEQVSHHPPVAACHCSSSNWTLNQEMMMKNKFWGRSLEVIPVGFCEVHLARWKETYTWNKVTTCITGLFSPSERSLEHYGDMILKCDSGVVCTVKFHKPESKRPDSFRAISGVVHSTGHEVDSNWTLFGKWDEYIICRNNKKENNCIWRPNTLPSNSSCYYGFTAFAITLNEPVPQAEVELGRIPITDCRLRPDQRLLEEGRIEEAEIEKSRLEDEQRRRMKLQAIGEQSSSNPKEAVWNSRWFRQTRNSEPQDETRPALKFDESYWKIREQCGFKRLNLPALW